MKLAIRFFALVALTASPLFSADIPALEQKAKQGDAGAQFELARDYLKGDGVAKDEKRGFELMSAAAKQGHAEAEAGLGYLYAKGLGVAADEKEAAKWMRKAADQGLAKAQHNLGTMLLSAKEPDDKEGVALLEKAASQGFKESQIELGRIYYFGDHGVAKDGKKAFQYLLLPAAAGDAVAQNFIGVMYQIGFGADKDPARAFTWFQQAAESGEAKAQGNLANLYATGSGVPRDLVQAYKWFSVSLLSGGGSAVAVQEIKGDLTPAEIAQGDKLIKEFQEKQTASSKGGAGSPAP